MRGSLVIVRRKRRCDEFLGKRRKRKKKREWWKQSIGFSSKKREFCEWEEAIKVRGWVVKGQIHILKFNSKIKFK